MRKLILAALISFTAAPAFCWYKIERTNRGIFGYDVVYETTAGPNTILGCSNPGRKSCHGSGIISVTPSGPVIDNSSVDDINKTVDQRIADAEYGKDTKGNFYYGSDFYVEFTYVFASDKIEINIYSVKEAKDLGLI